ncbi:hypothetical protein BH23ACT6_BH23ACT6_27340 [soil metagenome]
MATRWSPSTEAELISALEDGRLDEGPHLDFKRELPTGKKANLELARDLAMFANDGGLLVFGVAEPVAGRYDATGVELEGLRERIEQVAATRLEPPLHVAVASIPNATRPSRGYVIVRVPASASAPHMVDGRYYGRAGTTRSVLSDAQVRAVITSRQAAIQPIYRLLDEDVVRDPVPTGQRAHAHLHVVARPRFASDDLVLADVERVGDSWSTWFHKCLLPGSWDPRLGSWSPDLANQASNVGRRANGAALYSHYIGQDRSAADVIGDPEKLQRYEDDLLDLEVDEGGMVHLFCGRGSDTLRGSGEVLIPAVVAGLVLRTVEVAARITGHTGYVGTWDFAVAVTDLRSVARHTTGLGQGSATYSADGYRHATSADRDELMAAPQACADRLIGRLLRGLGLDGGIYAVFPPRASG